MDKTPELPTWITVRTIAPKGQEAEAETEVFCQVSTIKRISPALRGDGAIKAKITFLDGEVYGVADSYTYLKALVTGTLEKGYTAPEPKDP